MGEANRAVDDGGICPACPLVVVDHKHHEALDADKQPHDVEDNVCGCFGESPSVELQRELQHVGERLHDHVRRLLQLVEEQPTGCGKELAVGGGDLFRNDDGAIGLPLAGLEHDGVENVLQRHLRESVDVLWLGEEVEQQGDAQIRGREVRQDQFGVALRQLPVEVVHLFDVEEVLLALDESAHNGGGIRPADADFELLPKHPCKQGVALLLLRRPRRGRDHQPDPNANI